MHENDKLRRRLELEKEELHQALEEAEAALELGGWCGAFRSMI